MAAVERDGADDVADSHGVSLDPTPIVCGSTSGHCRTPPRQNSRHLLQLEKPRGRRIDHQHVRADGGRGRGDRRRRPRPRRPARRRAGWPGTAPRPCAASAARPACRASALRRPVGRSRRSGSPSRLRSIGNAVVASARSTSAAGSNFGCRRSSPVASDPAAASVAASRADPARCSAAQQFVAHGRRDDRLRRHHHAAHAVQPAGNFVHRHHASSRAPVRRATVADGATAAALRC